MKLLFSLFIAIVLTGCATPSDRRKNPPDIVTSSKKSAKEVSICIADKWENISTGFYRPMVNTSLKLNGYSIMGTNTGNTNTDILADVTENQLESTTKYYKMGGGVFDVYDQAVRDCQ